MGSANSLTRALVRWNILTSQLYPIDHRYRLCLVILFKGQKSMQKWKVSSSLRTKCGCETQTLLDGSMMFSLSISFIVWFILLLSNGDSHLVAIQTGCTTVVRIVCVLWSFSCGIALGIPKRGDGCLWSVLWLNLDEPVYAWCCC